AARLNVTEPGPGCIHFSARLDAAFFAQLTAERVQTKWSNGRPVRQWVPRRPGARNEALDCYVYASAALQGLYSGGLRLADMVDRLDRVGAVAPLQGALLRSSWVGGRR
ncbi:MAG: phage terminase large subunit family protein, partial [Alphaproteobacteria bacterium]